MLLLLLLLYMRKAPRITVGLVPHALHGHLALLLHQHLRRGESVLSRPRSGRRIPAGTAAGAHHGSGGLRLEFTRYLFRATRGYELHAHRHALTPAAKEATCTYTTTPDTSTSAPSPPPFLFPFPVWV
eukprot:COSAG05_NODE_3085_length_2336_cov_9.426911_2_plen_128_part_00